MITKLIKLNNEFYLIDADSNNSKKGEVNYDRTIRCILENDDLAHSDCCKVLASTKKINGINQIDKKQVERMIPVMYKSGITDEEIEQICYTTILSKNKWAHLPDIVNRPNPIFFWNEVDDMMTGYKKAIQGNEKNYTLEDMRDFSKKCGMLWQSEIDYSYPELVDKLISDMIEEKNEWDAEIELETKVIDLERSMHISDFFEPKIYQNGFLNITKIKN